VLAGSFNLSELAYFFAQKNHYERALHHSLLALNNEENDQFS
jgi:hypothetical protein